MMSKHIISVIAVIALAGAAVLTLGPGGNTEIRSDAPDIASTSAGNLQIATFAGGCFWCIESTFEKIPGVVNAVSGYAGGNTDHPTYYDVGAGDTGHTETVQIHYDPEIVSYQGLLHYFWREIDPTDAGGQFVDRGSMYRPAVFYHDEKQKKELEQSLINLEKSNRFSEPLVVEQLPLTKFWKAEGYHQDYYKKSPLRYKVYRHGSGRDQYLDKVWGDKRHEAWTDPDKKNTSQIAASAQSNLTARYSKPSDEQLKSLLTPLQYKVTQHEGTERPYNNPYWNHKSDGIYVDITSGEPLFSSTTKYDSRTGWPSFWAPINKDFIVEKVDFKIGFPRTEVRSKYGDAHLGHVFKDGPAPTGLRYCINSASLRFVPKEELATSGYEEYLDLFAQ